MARLIMWNLMTLDGFVEGPNHDISWHEDVWGEELEQLSIQQLNEAGGLLFGRVTYELMAGHWPGATGEVADFFGVPDRGRLTVGAAADLVVFDPTTVDDCAPEYVHDLPNGAKRLIARARGVDATVVAGKIVYKDGEPTGARPGTVLRGGR